MACIIKVPYTVGLFASLLPPPPLNMFTAGGDSLGEELIFLLPIVKLLWLSMWPHRQRSHYFYWMRPPAEWMIPAYKPWIIERGEISQRESGGVGRGTRSWWLDGQDDGFWKNRETGGWLVNLSFCFITVCRHRSHYSLSLPLPPSLLIDCSTPHFPHDFTMVSFQFLAYELHVALFLTIQPTLPNALFFFFLSFKCFNYLFIYFFLLTSCIHPS